MYSQNLLAQTDLDDYDDFFSLNTNMNSHTFQQQTCQSSPPNYPKHQPYKKIRPEPINEKTLVGSVVGFLQDVVGADMNKQGQILHTGHSSTHHKSSSSQNQCNSHLPNEVKEQIEWLHFENFSLLDSTSVSTQSSSPLSKSAFSNSSILLLIGYKTGFSVWTIDLNGVATEALSIREPNITHVKLLQIEHSQKLLIAISKLILNDDLPPVSLTGTNNTLISLISSTNQLDDLETGLNQFNAQVMASSSNTSVNAAKKHNISILNLFNGECIREIVFNGDILEMKSNSDLLCVNSWNRIDAFDLSSFEHRFSINSCYSQISKSTGKTINPFALGDRWIAFADNKYHGMLGSLGGVSTDIEQSYTATVLNTAKSISKGLVKISETVVNSVVSKSKSSNSSASNTLNGVNNSPRSTSGKKRHDSKEEFRAGICTIVDTKKYQNNGFKPQILHDENQNWIIAHFLAHHEPIYALEFNPNGSLLVTADSLGQYFNVFQINSNAFKCTRTIVKHLYSLHRGDTNAKVRNMSFSSDSRWLAIGTKRGTTHIFPINLQGGPVNARTHSKPYVVNRTSKHQRTSGFADQDELLNLNTHTTKNTSKSSPGDMQQYENSYNESSYSPLVINNNPKLKNLLEPFVIPAYGQLKQPNANSSFQSSVISSNGSSSSANAASSLTCVSGQQLSSQSTLNSNIGLTGANLAASAFQSAALVTENVTNFASNTSNIIQYDNVCAVSVFAESRGYLSPEDPRDYASNRLKPANSLFVISDVNGNLVEYVLDILVDTSKTPGNKPSNDSPIQLKITPKAQWPLHRYISNDEVRYPIQIDNPLLRNGFSRNSLRKQNSNSNNIFSDAGLYSNIALNSYSPSNSNTPSLFSTAPNSLTNQSSSNDWIKMIEVNTHIGPHRRLFMGPQFVFKTFNSNLTTTMVNATSSSVMSDSETPMIDLSGDIELNSLDLSSGSRKFTNKFIGHTTLPMQINSNNNKSRRYDSTPTFIEIGAGSYQEGMPILCESNLRGSQKSLNNHQGDPYGENLIDCLADAMNELNTIQNHKQHPGAKLSNGKSISPAIAIKSSKTNDPNMLLMNANTIPAASSVGSNSSVFTVGSYFLINPNATTPTGNAGPTVNTSLTSCTSSSSASSSSSGSSSNSKHYDESVSSSDNLRNGGNHLQLNNHYESNLFQDENLLH